MKTIILAIVVYVVMRTLEIRFFPTGVNIDAILLKMSNQNKLPQTLDLNGKPVTGKYVKTIDAGNGQGIMVYDNGQMSVAIMPDKK